MPFCPNCGQQLNDGMRFCPNCGTPVTAAAQPVIAQPVVAQPVIAQPAGYQLVLVSLGDCTKTATRDLLEEILGYTVTEARKLSDNVPIPVADSLTDQQALYLAQMMTEYGLTVAVIDPYGHFVDLTPYATKSVFSQQGTLYANVLALLGTLNTVNKVTSFLPIVRPDLLRHTFMPRYERARNRVYVRRGHAAPPAPPVKIPVPPRPPVVPPKPPVVPPKPPVAAPKGPAGGHGPKGPMGGHGPKGPMGGLGRR